MTKIPRILALAAMAGTLAFTAPVVAQDKYPSDTINIVVSYPPGGFNDTVARMIAEDFSGRWDQSVVVDNRPGGGTVVGTEYVASSDPDGHTMGISPFAFGVNPGLFPQLPYDTEKDLKHAIVLGEAFNVLVAHPDFGPNTVEELIAYAKENPGDVNYASAGNGSSNHLSGELFKSLAEVDAVHIPYSGSAPARTDLMAGRVDILFDNYTNVAELVETGKVKALAVTTTKETEQMPGVPPVSDTVEGYEVSTWWGVYVPAETPDEVVATLNEALNEFLKKDSTKKVFKEQAITPVGGSVEEAEAFVKRQLEQWIPVAEQAQMKVD